MPYRKHISTIFVWKVYMGTRTGKLKNIYVRILEQKKFRVEVVYTYTSKNFNIDQYY